MAKPEPGGHGRPKHKAAGGCATGLPGFERKVLAERAFPGVRVKRCHRCRKWHPPREATK